MSPESFVDLDAVNVTFGQLFYHTFFSGLLCLLTFLALVRRV